MLGRFFDIFNSPLSSLHSVIPVSLIGVYIPKVNYELRCLLQFKPNVKQFSYNYYYQRLFKYFQIITASLCLYGFGTRIFFIHVRYDFSHV